MAKKGTYISHDTRVREIVKLIESIGYRHGIQTIFDMGKIKAIDIVDRFI